MIKVEHVAWQVGDPEAVTEWYCKQFGFTILRQVDNAARMRFIADASGKVVIEIYNNPKVRVLDYRSMDPLYLHIAFAVEDPASVRDALVQAGASIAEDLITAPTGDQLVMLRDPWGFPVQLVKRKTPMITQ